jgi:uncharacterized protein (UPF0335 family)
MIQNNETKILHYPSHEEVKQIVQAELQPIREQIERLEAEIELIKRQLCEQSDIKQRLSDVELDVKFVKRVVSKM